MIVMRAPKVQRRSVTVWRSFQMHLRCKSWGMTWCGGERSGMGCNPNGVKVHNLLSLKEDVKKVRGVYCREPGVHCAL